ncbi:MAG: LysR family transcriptional regulator [Rhodocyclaceae bacterium]|nr:MAG: LysR family transcriptional regulator [Rhodocyclaceae bacterium]
MNLGHLETLLSVVAQGGFHEAARATHRSQSTLSQHVRKLEESLGVTLLNRNAGGCRLTVAGEAFIPYAESLIRTADRARALFAGCSLRVGASSNIGVYLLPQYLRSYRDINPNQDVSLVIDTNPAVVERLDRREIDVAILELWDSRPGFVAIPWRREELVVIVDCEHPWAHEASLLPEALLDCELLGGEAGSGTARLLRERLGSVAESLRVRAQLGSTEAVKRAVQAGLGISIVMAGTVATEVACGSLRAIPLQGVPVEKELYLAYGERLLPGSPALVFRDHMVKPTNTYNRRMGMP